jgi:hypothetical protein
MCEGVSIADDFDVRRGVVSGGVSLSIRPAETNPLSPDMSPTRPADRQSRAQDGEVLQKTREDSVYLDRVGTPSPP